MSAEEALARLIEGYGESWQDDAACVGVDPSLFFPERGKTAREAKKICAECVVREECLTFGVETRQPYGVWGGMTERERRAERRRRRERNNLTPD